MAMEMKLNFKQEMRLVPTPMLQQAIKLLQLSRLELAQAVHQEMVENPNFGRNPRRRRGTGAKTGKP